MTSDRFHPNDQDEPDDADGEPYFATEDDPDDDGPTFATGDSDDDDDADDADDEG